MAQRTNGCRCASGCSRCPSRCVCCWPRSPSWSRQCCRWCSAWARGTCWTTPGSSPTKATAAPSLDGVKQHGRSRPFFIASTASSVICSITLPSSRPARQCSRECSQQPQTSWHSRSSAQAAARASRMDRHSTGMSATRALAAGLAVPSSSRVATRQRQNASGAGILLRRRSHGILGAKRP